MKFSLKLPDDRCHQNPLLKAKIPITIFNQPFTSAVTTAVNSASDLSFSISSDFPSGPSIKLSYSPSAASSLSAASAPFSLLLKSGLGVFGSPGNSPLVFSAHLSLSHTRSLVPTFSLHFKPQFGNFCLKKCTSSNPNPRSRTSDGVDLDSGSPSVSLFGSGFLQEDSTGWQELKLESASGASFNGGVGCASHRQLLEESGGKAGFLSGIAVMARTLVPVTKQVAVNFRWGVNFPANLPAKMPYLTVNKVTIERVNEMKEAEKKSDENDVGDIELLKGICSWMRRDLETLEKENREMRQNLEEMKMRNFRKNVNGEKTGSSRLGEDDGGFERRSNKNGGEGQGKKMQVKAVNKVSEVESELERAIMAASQLQGSLCAARRAAAFVRGDDVIHKLFTELAYRYRDRACGYTRLLRTRIHVGDAAPMAYIEFIDRENELRQSKPPNPQPPQRAPLDPWTRSKLTTQFAPPKDNISDSDA